jgi:hypothetical protein
MRELSRRVPGLVALLVQLEVARCECGRRYVDCIDLTDEQRCEIRALQARCDDLLEMMAAREVPARVVIPARRRPAEGPVGTRRRCAPRRRRDS